MYDGFEFGVTVAVERPSDLKKISYYLREHFISQGPSYAVSRPTTMNRQEETTESLRTTQLATSFPRRRTMHWVVTSRLCCHLTVPADPSDRSTCCGWYQLWPKGEGTL